MPRYSGIPDTDYMFFDPVDDDDITRITGETPEVREVDVRRIGTLDANIHLNMGWRYCRPGFLGTFVNPVRPEFQSRE